jgi:hypothetical protein
MFITIGITEGVLFFWYDRAALKEDFRKVSSLSVSDFMFNDYFAFLSYVLPSSLLLLLILLALSEL